MWSAGSRRVGGGSQAAWLQVEQLQSSQTQFAHSWRSPQLLHEHTLWLQVSQVQSGHVHTAQLSVQLSHEQVVHSS